MSLSDLRVSSIGLTSAIALCIILYGCSGNSVILWSAESKSPNGDWIALAHTLKSSGFGTGSIGTGVYLKRPRSAGSGTQVLGFANRTAYPVGITAVTLEWISDSHLDVTYNQDAKLNFQAIKADGVEITVHQSRGAK